MKASWEKIEKNEGILHVELGADKVAASLDQAFKKVAKKVNVPGFRKGKVPRQVFEAKFGIESLYQDAIDILLPGAYEEGVKETGIKPVARPEVDDIEFESGKPAKFAIKVIVKPEVQLGEYKGLEVEAQETEVTTDEVNAEIEKLQERHAELVVVDEGAAQNGDMTIIDFEGFVEGEAFEGGKAERYSLELGSGSFIPGFEDQVVGMETGDDKDITVTFPETYHAENLAGKEAVFKVKLHEIKRKNLPELDDEFAKDVSEFDTLEELKQDTENRLKEQKEQASEQAKETAVIEKAAANAEIDIPEAMIDTEVDFMFRDFANRLRMQGLSTEMYFQFSGQNEDQIKDQMRSDAEKRVRNNLVLEAIAAAENVQITEEELNEELSKLAEQYQKSAEEIKSILSANGNLEDIEQDVVNRKTIKLLLENSKTVTTVA